MVLDTWRKCEIRTIASSAKPCTRACATVDSTHKVGKSTMSTLEKLVRDRAEEIRAVAGRHGAVEVRLFGSVARHEATDVSDVDFLVLLEPGRSILDLGGLQFDLEKLLGRRVDVVTERGLKRRMRERVLKDAVPL